MAKNKICHLVVADGISGAENHLLKLIPSLSSQKYEVHFVVMTPHYRIYEEFLKRCQKIKVVFIPLREKVNPINLFHLFRLFRKEQYDLLHTHNSRADVYGILAGKMAEIKVTMASIHGYQRYDQINPLFKIRGWILRNFSDCVITISDALKDLIAENEGIDRKRMVTVYYGLEHLHSGEGGLTVRREFNLDPDTPLLVDVGRLIPVKSHDTLIRALTRIIPSFPNLRLFIIGEGILKEELKELVRTLGLEDHVIFTGYREDVSRFMKDADLFIFPTLGEGFGLVLLEAMVFKKPVVATRVMSIPEIVEDGRSGLLVPPRHPEELADAILQLLNDKKRAESFGNRGFDILSSKFSIERMVKETEQIYDRLLKEKGAAVRR
jgi:glycosyltransferase involved in cell wall biosynthesis